MSPYFAAALGIAAGLGYFQAGESKIPTEANCSYLAAPITDGLALAAGALLIANGITRDDPASAFIGAAIGAVHASQYLHHKGIKPWASSPQSS